MKTVSSAYKTGMAGLLRERSYAVVKFYNIDAEAANDGVWTANGEMPWSSFDTLDYLYEYGDTATTLEWNRWTLDGTQDILNDSVNDGFVSDKMSDANGAFPSYCIMTRQFEDIHMFPGITLTFDTRTEEWPTAATLKFYLGNDLVKEISSEITSQVLELETNVEDADKLQIVFDSALPYRRPRVQYVIYGVGREYTNDDILSLEQYTDVDPLSRRLPDERFTFTILDYEHRYDPDNPEGIYRFVEINSPVYVKFGYTLADGTVEWVKEDHYLLDSQPEVFNNQATFTATGLIGSLTGTFYKSKLGRKSFYDMAVEILRDADLTPTSTGAEPWVIDETLTAMYTDAVLPIDTHMNCLQLIAHACRCRLYTDDDNIIHIEPFGVTVAGIFSGEFSDNGHTSYSEWDSVNTGQNTQETYATLEWNRWMLDGMQTILPDVPGPTGYVSELVSDEYGNFADYGIDVTFHVDENGDLIAEGDDAGDFYLSGGDLYYTGSADIYIQDGVLYANGTGDEPHFTRVFDVKNDLPVVGLRFDQFLDEYPTWIEVKYYEDDKLIDTQSAEPDATNYLVLSDAARNCNKIVVTCYETLPYYRFRVSKVYYKQTDFSLNFDNMTISTQYISKIDKLKNVTVAKTIYTPSDRTTRLYQATTDEEELHIELSAIAENINVTLSNGLIKYVTTYGRAVDLIVSPGMKTITITGNTIAASTAIKTYNISNRGETDAEENPLITDDEMRDALAKHVANYLQMRNTYDVDYRGNPELEAGDVIGYQTAYTDEFYALVLVDELRYGGSLSGSVKAKGLLDSSMYDEIKIVAVVNPPGAGEISGTGSYEAGDLVTVTATPNEDYGFGYWMENGERIGTSATLQFIATKSRRLTAVFLASDHVNITLFTSPDGAGVVTGGGAYDVGDTVTVSVTPAGGYNFIGWSDSGEMVSAETSYTFTAEQSRVLTAVFQEFTHTVTVSTEGGGTVSGGGTYHETSIVTVTARASRGYKFVRWLENGKSVSTDAEYTFALTADRTLVAVFDVVYTISVTSTAGGTATGGGEYGNGATVTLIATPEDGYDFVGWQSNGSYVSTSTAYTFTANGNASYKAVFTEHIPVIIYDRATTLSINRCWLAATSIGDYALFGGGRSSTGAEAEVDAFTEDLTRTNPSNLYSGRFQLAAASNANYAVFAGGWTGNLGSGLTSVYGYDASLTKTQATSMTYRISRNAGASVGAYALFAGGAGGSTYTEQVYSGVYTYDRSLTRSTTSGLSSVRFLLGGTQNDSYAVFAGGSNGSAAQTTVWAYNSSLTRSAPTVLSAARSYIGTAGNGTYAIFAGGNDGTNYFSTVNAYNKSLTRSTPTALVAGRSSSAGTRLGIYAMFAGGYDGTNRYTTAESYDQSLTRGTPQALSVARCYLAAATVGRKAIFGGGYNGTYLGTVDAYRLE